MGLLGKALQAIAGRFASNFDIDSFEFEKFAAKVEGYIDKANFIKTDITNEESIKNQF